MIKYRRKVKLTDIENSDGRVFVSVSDLKLGGQPKSLISELFISELRTAWQKELGKWRSGSQVFSQSRQQVQSPIGWKEFVIFREQKVSEA